MDDTQKLDIAFDEYLMDEKKHEIIQAQVLTIEKLVFKDGWDAKAKDESQGE